MTHPSEHPEDTCQRCGRPNVVWFAPSSLWNAAIEPREGREAILCPVCFIQSAEADKVYGPMQNAWKVVPEFYEEGTC